MTDPLAANMDGGGRFGGAAPAFVTVDPHARRSHYSQPPVNPARRSPATKYGQRRVMSQIRPVR